MKKYKLDFISTSRADFSLVYPIVLEASSRKNLQVRLVLTGSHYSKEQSNFLRIFEGELKVEIKYVVASGIGYSPKKSGLALGLMVKGFSELWSEESKPDLCFLLGDRFELMAPASVATLYGLQIAHAFGGECDVGYCLDTQVRDAVTKMAHLHFVSHEIVRQRLLEMGEESWRIFVTGNPSVEVSKKDKNTFLNFCKENGIRGDKFIAACYLPVTHASQKTDIELDNIFRSLEQCRDYSVIWTGINADPGSQELKEKIRKYCFKNDRNYYFESLGSENYSSLLCNASFMIGNSSSGLLESGSYQIPVINVGLRQAGRLAGINVINVSGDYQNISKAIEKIFCDEKYLDEVKRMKNPFFVEKSSKKIVDAILLHLKKEPNIQFIKRNVLDINKKYYDVSRMEEFD